jgi:hypothetical protein
MATVTLQLRVSFDPHRTDGEAVAAALDRLLTTARSTPGILEDIGPVDIGELTVASPDIWVMLDHNRHGIDFSLHDSLDAARATVVDLMREWIDETKDAKAHEQIVALLCSPDVHVTDRYQRLLQLWTEATDESFEIESRRVES